MLRLRFPRAAYFIACVAAAAITAACSNSSNPVAPASPSVTETQTLPAAGSTLTLPTWKGYTESFVVPSGAPAGTTTTDTVSLKPLPGSATPLSFAADGSVKTLSAKTLSSGASVLLYIEATFSQTFSFSSFPTFTIGVPSTVSASGLTLEIFNGTSGALVAAAAGAATGQSVSFTFYTPGPWSIVASQPYVIELVSGSGLNLSFKPGGNGDAFVYAGSLTETFVRPPISAAPTPYPNPTSTQTLTANVSVKVAVTATAAPTGGGTLSTFTSSETDAYSSPPETLTSTTSEVEAYATPAPSGSVSVSEQSSSTSTSTGATTATTIGAGNGLLDVLPELAGPITPANTAAETIAETDPTGQSSSQVYNADGSYTETVNYPGGSTSTATENSDGSGVYDVPIEQVPGSTVVYAAPSGGNINITLTLAAGLTGPNPLVIPYTIPAWYPNPTSPPVLYAQEYTDLGAATPPTTCAIPASLSEPTNELVQTTTTVDTVFGEAETQTAQSYDAQGLGTVCMVLSDVTQQYYDFTGQSQATLTFSGDGTPLETITYFETLGLQSATVVGTSSVVRAAEARFQALVAHDRALRHAAAIKKLKAAVTIRLASTKGAR